MTEQHLAACEPANSTRDASTKRLYQKPAFSHETVFETMALACGKIRGQGQEQCRRVSSNS